MMTAAFHIARLEGRLALRKAHQLAAIGLFAICAVYLVFQADGFKQADAWAAQLWVVYLFSIFSAAGRLFDREQGPTRRYLQWAVQPRALIGGKLLYAWAMTGAMTLLVFVAFYLFLGVPEGSHISLGALIGAGFWGAFAMSTTVTTVTAIASQTQAGPAIAAVLGLPLLIPQLILCTRMTRELMAGVPWIASEHFVFLGSLGLGTAVLAVLLFPYIWRS